MASNIRAFPRSAAALLGATYGILAPCRFRIGGVSPRACAWSKRGVWAASPARPRWPRNGAPCRAAGGRSTRPAGARTRRCARSRSAGCAVREPAEPVRVPAGQDARRATGRGALSLGYFSLGKQREVTRRPQADETARETRVRADTTAFARLVQQREATRRPKAFETTRKSVASGHHRTPRHPLAAPSPPGDNPTPPDRCSPASLPIPHGGRPIRLARGARASLPYPPVTGPNPRSASSG